MISYQIALKLSAHNDNKVVYEISPDLAVSMNLNWSVNFEKQIIFIFPTSESVTVTSSVFYLNLIVFKLLYFIFQTIPETPTDLSNVKPSSFISFKSTNEIQGKP